MKAICIRNEDDNSMNHWFNIGKVYDIDIWKPVIIKELEGCCEAIDDRGKRHTLPAYWFKPIDQYRQEQINKVLE